MKKLTEQECKEIGGHCWNYHSANECVDERGELTGVRIAMYFPDGEPRYRTCKHCGKTESESPSEWK
jgi:hypothetical protein